MKVKYTDIEFYNHKTKKWDRHPVSAVFTLAICHLVPGGKRGGIKDNWCGINIGIAIPHKDAEEAREFYDKCLFSPGHFYQPSQKREHSYLYLIGENGVKVPVHHCDGNGYEPLLGTSCLFVYFEPALAGPDEQPNLYGTLNDSYEYNKNFGEKIKDRMGRG